MSARKTPLQTVTEGVWEVELSGEHGHEWRFEWPG